MFTAKQALETSQAFDREANTREMANKFLKGVDEYIRGWAEKGQTDIDWVPTLTPEKYPKEAFEMVIATLRENGYTVTQKTDCCYNIKWG